MLEDNSYIVFNYVLNYDARVYVRGLGNVRSYLGGSINSQNSSPWVARAENSRLTVLMDAAPPFSPNTGASQFQYLNSPPWLR